MCSHRTMVQTDWKRTSKLLRRVHTECITPRNTLCVNAPKALTPPKMSIDSNDVKVVTAKIVRSVLDFANTDVSLSLSCMYIFLIKINLRAHVHSLIKKLIEVESFEASRAKAIPLAIRCLFTEPWSSRYGRTLMFQRSWARIPAQYTGWTFFTFICFKNCNLCLKRRN